MWSNFINTDAVKFVIDLGTKLVKLAETLGLIPSILVSIASFKILQSIFKGTDIIGFIKSIGALTMGTKVFEAETRKASMALIGEAINAKLAGSALVEYAIKMKLATASDVAKMTTTELLGLSFKALGAAVWGATKAIIAFLFTNPVGWVILAIGAIASGIAIFNHFHKTAEELTEELNDLKTELQDIQNEIDSLNSELETTKSRMAELLAMDSLSFTEEEELSRLRKQNDELQREIDLQKTLQKSKQKEIDTKFKETMQEKLDTKYTKDNKNGFVGTYTKKSNWLSALVNGQVSGEEALQVNIDAYLDKKELVKSLEKQAVEAQQIINDPKTSWIDKIAQQAYVDSYNDGKESLDALEKSIADRLEEYRTDIEGIEYGDDPEVNAYLDYVNNMLDRWAIKSGGENAKTNAISRIFNKDENNVVSDSIDAYVEALKNGDTSAKSSIENIIKNNADLVEDIEASGLSINDAVDYFTSFASEANYATLEGKIDEVSKAATNFEKLLKGGLFKVDDVDTGLADLFDKEGKIIQTKLSQVFQDTSDQTREEITRILESSYDIIKGGLDDSKINYLMNRMGLSFSRAILEIEKSDLINKNFELFPGLKDEISGIIDTFSELTSAVGSVVDAMDALDQARAEEAYSGSVSLETLEALMKSTDNYADLIEVDETGAIRLATDAQEILVAQKIEAIKQNAALALEEAELAYQEALHNEQTYSQTGPAQEFMRGLWNEVGGAMAFVSSLWNDLTNGNWDGAWDRAKEAQKNSITKKETDYANKAAEASVAVAEAAKNVDNAKKLNDVAQGLTQENIKIRSSSEEASGGADTKEEAEQQKAEDAWEKLLSEYENKLALITNERDLIQAEIDKAEAQGGQASKELYNDLIRSQLEEKQLLEEKKIALEAYLAQYADSIDPDTWTEYNNEINDTAVAIKECTTNIYDFAKSLREIDMHYFEQAVDDVSRLGEEIEFIMGLFEDEDMSDAAGNWTAAGITKINLMRDLMTTYVAQAKMWQNRLNELGSMTKGKNGLYSLSKETRDAIASDFKSMLDSKKISQDVYDDYIKQLNDAFAQGGFSEELWKEWNDEAEDGLRNAISSQKDIQDQMLDMYDEYIDKVEEGIEKEIEAYEDLIDVKKEELQAERDLYNFRKDVQKQSKSISDLERRIVSLSGSTAAADVAERRKLQAELNEAKSNLDDTYYDHAQDAMSNALDNEVKAYTDVKNKYVETMREAADDTEWVINEMILNGIFNADVANDFLTRIHDTYNIPLSPELEEPWKKAAEQAIKFKNQVGIIAGTDIPPSVTMISDDITNKLGTDDANNPWNKAISMANKYADFLTTSEFSLDSNDMSTFEGQISSIVNNWNKVKKAADDAYYAQTRKTEVGGNPNLGGSTSGNGNGVGIGSSGSVGGSQPKPALLNVDNQILSKYKLTSSQVLDLGYGPLSLKAFEDLLKNYQIKYSAIYKQVANTRDDERALKRVMHGQYVSGPWAIRQYAKGTLSTKKNEWAITDEPQFGDELVLVPTEAGNLSYMRKGTGVVPAELTANLMEWGKFTPDSMNFGGGVNVNMINNAVTKPNYELNFDSLVHVDAVNSDTLPKLEKMVDKKIDEFSRALNYSIKKFAR